MADPEGGSYTLVVLKNDWALHLWVVGTGKRSGEIAVQLTQDAFAALP